MTPTVHPTPTRPGPAPASGLRELVAPGRGLTTRTSPVPAQHGPTEVTDDELDPSPTRETIAELADCHDPARAEQLRDELVHQHLGLATSIAGRYRDRGIAFEDLRQVAHLALTKASRRFDPRAGHRFTAFCAPTIRGEVRRHFRDLGWVVRPPRRVQDLQPRLARATEQLTDRLDRAPTEQELAEHLDVSREEVREAMSSEGCFAPASLDRRIGEGDGGQGGSASLGDLLSGQDDEQEEAQRTAEARTVLGPHVRALGARDRRILELRFFVGLTQREIAEDIGVTQMQVSRLLTRILGDLRRSVGPLDA